MNIGAEQFRQKNTIVTGPGVAWLPPYVGLYGDRSYNRPGGLAEFWVTLSWRRLRGMRCGDLPGRLSQKALALLLVAALVALLLPSLATEAASARASARRPPSLEDVRRRHLRRKMMLAQAENTATGATAPEKTVATRTMVTKSTKAGPNQ